MISRSSLSVWGVLWAVRGVVLKRKKQSSSCVWSVECGVVVLFVILVVVFHLFRAEGRDTIYIYIDFVRV